jgi:hypothetical protein
VPASQSDKKTTRGEISFEGLRIATTLDAVRIRFAWLLGIGMGLNTLVALAGEPIAPLQTTRTGPAKLNVTVSPSLSCVDRSALVERLRVMLASLRGPELGPLQVAISGSPLALKVAVNGSHGASETTLTSPRARVLGCACVRERAARL